MDGCHGVDSLPWCCLLETQWRSGISIVYMSSWTLSLYVFVIHCVVSWMCQINVSLPFDYEESNSTSVHSFLQIVERQLCMVFSFDIHNLYIYCIYVGVCVCICFLLLKCDSKSSFHINNAKNTESLTRITSELSQESLSTSWPANIQI